MAVSYADMIAIGWTPTQLAQHYPELTGPGTALTTQQTGYTPWASPPAGVPDLSKIASATVVQPAPLNGGNGGGFPWDAVLAGIAGLATGGIGAGLLAGGTALATTGTPPAGGDAPWWLEWLPIPPWMTEEGEGWIAPWTGERVTPSGEYGQIGTTYMSDLVARMRQAAPYFGGMITKMWTNAPKLVNGQGQPTVMFAKLTNGKVMSMSLISGEIKAWKPKKHIVISSNPRLKTLNKLDRVYKRVTKSVRKYAPKPKTSTQAPSAYLSAAERKLLNR